MHLLLTFAIAMSLQQALDGTALTFTVSKDSVTVQVGRWKLTSNKAEEMNRFVDRHIKEIDPDKIVIYGDSELKYPSFQSVIDVLKKHDWMKFKMEPTKRKPSSSKNEARHT